MEFGTWYQINCEEEEQWREDFPRIAEAGFDFVVLWNMLPPIGDRLPGDVRPIITEAGATLRALDEVARAGLTAYLGIWHPYSMGKVSGPWRPRFSNGRRVEGPDIFNRVWLNIDWQPYVQAAGRLCASHPACRGVFMDDTFPATAGALDGYLGYAGGALHFRQWLAARYGSVANLNMTHQFSPGFHAYGVIEPPRDPLQNLALWSDWMQARDEWCEDFIARTRQALSDTWPDAPRLELVLSDRDYHMLCTPLQYGVDYSHLMRHADRLETYMAAGHTAVPRRDLLGNVRRIVRRGVELAVGKPFLFHTWFADLVTLQPMDAGLLVEIMEAAAEEGASGFEVYTYKVHDWRKPARTLSDAWERPALPEVSLKFHPDLLAAIAHAIRALKDA